MSFPRRQLCLRVFGDPLLRDKNGPAIFRVREHFERMRNSGKNLSDGVPIRGRPLERRCGTQCGVKQDGFLLHPANCFGTQVGVPHSQHAMYTLYAEPTSRGRRLSP